MNALHALLAGVPPDVESGNDLHLTYRPGRAWYGGSALVSFLGGGGVNGGSPPGRSIAIIIRA